MQLNVRLAMLFAAALILNMALSSVHSTSLTPTNDSGEGASYASARGKNPKLPTEARPSEFCTPLRGSGVGVLIRFQANANFNSQALTPDALANSGGPASRNPVFFISDLLNSPPQPLPASSLAQTVDIIVGEGGDLGFSPQTVNINVGDTVRWTFDTGGHNVVSGSSCNADNKFCFPNDAGCSSAPISGSGAIYTHTFNEAGSFPYFCRPHCFDGMTGLVIVGAAPTPTPTPTPTPSIQFQAAGFSVNEGGGSATATVTRTDSSGAATVDYKTTDTDTFTVGCADTVNNLGSAYGRCDYATSNDTLSFAQGEASKSFVVPIIDDVHVEGPETFQVVLSNPSVGFILGTPTTATVTINDNDTPGTPNPILASDNAGIAFFVRQHYLDFLAREPEVGEPWSGILRPCADQFNFDPANPSAGCDRIIVSGSFFGSPEFLNKGVYVIVFYKVAFNRLPQYVEFAPDLRSVTGSTGPEAAAKRATFANNFVLRPEFTILYPTGMSNSAYVSALMGRYSLTSITTPDPANPDGTVKVTLTTSDLTNRLNGVGGTLTRAQVLRAIVQSDQVSGNLEAVNAFVASQYYGYLRRTPDTGGFNSWVTHLSQHPNDFRTMVNGFVNSIEYRLRFGPS